MDNTRTTMQPENNIHKNSSKKKNVFVLILIVLLLALGGVVLWQYQDAKKAKDTQALVTTQLSVAQTQITDLQGQLKTSAQMSTAQTAVKTDEEMIIETATAYVHAQAGQANAKVAVTIAKKELPFARAGVTVDDAFGVACVFKKADGSWLQLYCTQAVTDFTTQQDQLYSVPSSIIKS